MVKSVAKRQRPLYIMMAKAKGSRTGANIKEIDDARLRKAEHKCKPRWEIMIPRSLPFVTFLGDASEPPTITGNDTASF